MGRVTRVIDHSRVEERDERLEHCTESWRIRRWQVIHWVLVHPKPAAELPWS